MKIGFKRGTSKNTGTSKLMKVGKVSGVAHSVKVQRGGAKMK